jgi:curli biogenesis system outer membrane secretion channel CsgG
MRPLTRMLLCAAAVGGMLFGMSDATFAQRKSGGTTPASDAPKDAKPKKGGKITVAVIPQDNQRSWTKDIMVAELETALAGGRFNILSRDSLNSVISEQKLANSDLADPSAATSVGKLLSAQYVIVAKAVSIDVKESSIGFGGIGTKEKKMTVKVNMQLINAETGALIKSENYDGNDKTSSTQAGSFGNNADAPGQESFTKMMSGFAKRFAEVVSLQVPIETTVALVKDGQVIIRTGSAEGVQPGVDFEVILEGEPIRDSDGTILDRVVSKVAVIRASKVNEKVTYCDIIQTYDPNSKSADAAPNAGRIQTDFTVRQVPKVAPPVVKKGK